MTGQQQPTQNSQIAQKCSANPCKNGATCVDTFNGYNCICSPLSQFSGINCDQRKL